MKQLSLLAATLLAVALILSGCSNSNAIKIDEYTWIMTTVQSANYDGQVVAYGTGGSSTLETAVLSELECKAENGVLTLSDSTNNHTYTGSYKIAHTNPDSVIYDVKIGNTSGIAVCALTTYSDESNKPTFIISLEDYTLNFFADSIK